MIDILNSALTVLTSIVQFLINALTGFITIVTNIPQYIAFLSSAVAVLPPFLIPFILLGLSLAVLNLLIKREFF